MTTRGSYSPVLCRFLLASLLVSAELSLCSTSASAQWYKPWRWGKALPQAPQMPQLPQMPTLPSLGGNAAPAAGQPTVSQGGQATPSVSAPSAPVLTPEQIEERRMVVQKARERDAACDSTVTCARDRLENWKMVQIVDPTSIEGRLSYDRAQRDLQAAQSRDEKQAAKDEAQNTDRQNRLREARQDLRNNDFDAAASIVDDVLQATPDNATAQSLRAVIEGKREQRHTLVRLTVIGVIALVIIALLVWLAVIAVRKHRAASRTDAKASESRHATLQVIDGIGRGRSAAMAGDVFRIGATPGDEGTRNDLVLSDADARISRYHCNVTRRDGRFYLIDTSSNGTTLNGRPLARGEPKRLNSGDMVVVAESAVFTLTVH